MGCAGQMPLFADTATGVPAELPEAWSEWEPASRMAWWLGYVDGLEVGQEARYDDLMAT